MSASDLAGTPLLPGQPGTVSEPRPRALPRQLARLGFLVLLGGGIIGLVLLSAVLVPVLSSFDAYGQDLGARLLAPPWLDGTAWAQPFGTDALGRDVFVRVFVGARYSLAIAAAAVVGAGVIGTLLGLVAGYLGGLVDDGLMRLVDLQLAFPSVLLALALVALFGPSVSSLIVVFVLTGWPVFARTSRASTLTLKERTFVEATHGIGASGARVLFRHVLPNALGPLVVVATFELAKVLIYESSLGFLGLGVQDPTPTWGNMMSDGRSYLDSAWWVTFFPGAVLVVTAAAANWLGDGLNQLIDPRLRRR